MAPPRSAACAEPACTSASTTHGLKAWLPPAVTIAIAATPWPSVVLTPVATAIMALTALKQPAVAQLVEVSMPATTELPAVGPYVLIRRVTVPLTRLPSCIVLSATETRLAKPASPRTSNTTSTWFSVVPKRLPPRTNDSSLSRDRPILVTVLSLTARQTKPPLWRTQHASVTLFTVDRVTTATKRRA